MPTINGPPISMPKPKRRSLPLSLLFLLIPTSLLALSLLLFLLVLPCNGLSLLCLADGPPLLRDAVPSSSSSLLALSEEGPPLPKPLPHQSFNLSLTSLNGYPPPNSPLLSKVPKPSRRTRSLLRTLHPTARSRRFSARAAKFFDGYPCKPRFFIIWISSLEPLGPRELFAVESVFKSHPNACVLIVSNTMDSPKGATLLKPFLQRGFRVAALSPDFGYLFKSTPAEPWFKRLQRGDVDPGDVPLGQNLSNLLRLAVLYKFGGIYIDTDVIVLKSFQGLKNAIGAQTFDAETGNWSRLNNAVMVFDKKHPLLYKFIEEFALTFNGNKWGHNGPYLVSRVVSRMAGRPGFEFNVLPPAGFYPVGWSKIQGLFWGPRGGSHSRWVLAKHRWIREGSFAVHLWNRQSRRIRIEEGSIIGRIMLDCCLFCNSTASAMEVVGKK